MEPGDLTKVLRRLRKKAEDWGTPVVTSIGYDMDPFRVLIGCLLSLRTRDKNTKTASKRLFALADTPQKILKLKPKTIEKSYLPSRFFS